jgi:hypothetical protein
MLKALSRAGAATATNNKTLETRMETALTRRARTLAGTGLRSDPRAGARAIAAVARARQGAAS